MSRIEEEKIMNMQKETYRRFADAHAPHSSTLKNCLLAFLGGGTVCCIAQALGGIYQNVFEMAKEDAGTLASVTLILLSVILTGCGVFDKIAKHVGAGTLLPITGFANSVCSPAMEFKTEGYVYGMAAKMFIVAGPIIVFGVLSGTIVGLLYLFL